MTITQIILAGLLFVQVSCSFDKRQDKSNSNNNNDSCKALLTDFTYPDDLNKLDSFNYVCRDSFLKTIVFKNGLKAVPRFSDRNYVLFNYDFRTTLLFDKTNYLFFCFKRSVDSENFNRESVYSIYVLDTTGMPLYLIEQHPFEKETDITKLYYDDKHPQLYGYIVNSKAGKQPIMKELSYTDIVQLTKELLSERYSLTEKFISYSTPHFKTTPLWTDN